MSILVTYALSLVIEGALNMIFSVNDVQLQAWYVDRSFRLFGSTSRYICVRFSLGGRPARRALRHAVPDALRREHPRVARRPDGRGTGGIDVKRVATLCFGIGVAVTAAGGMVYGATNTFNASTSYDLITRLLTIIVLGGMGSLGGALCWPAS